MIKAATFRYVTSIETIEILQCCHMLEYCTFKALLSTNFNLIKTKLPILLDRTQKFNKILL
jgi:hypothetical protein